MDLSRHDRTYDPEKQKKASEFFVPESGIYDLVNVKLQFRYVGQAGTLIMRMTPQILAVKKLKNTSQKIADDSIGRTFVVDLWWDMSKPDNQRMLAHLLKAHNKPRVDVSPNDKEYLVEAICDGTPFRMEINKARRRNTSSEDPKYDARITVVHNLTEEEIAKYESYPDFGNILPEKEDRFADDWKQQQRQGRRSQSSSNNDPLPRDDWDDMSSSW